MTTVPPIRQTSAGAARLHSRHSEVVVLSNVSATARACITMPPDATESRRRSRSARDRDERVLRRRRGDAVVAGDGDVVDAAGAVVPPLPAQRDAERAGDRPVAERLQI